MEERWRPVLGHEGSYEVSDLGRVRSLDRRVLTRAGWRRYRGQLLRPGRDTRYGHLSVVLGNRETRSVHRLVLEAFVGPRPPGMEGCHGDGDPENCRLTNLRWDTGEGNMADLLRHGRHHEVNRKTCPRKHPLEEPNLTRSSIARGARNCLACNRVLSRRTVPDDEAVIQAESDAEYARIMAGKVVGWVNPDYACGHPMTAENSIPRKNRAPECRTCANASRRARERRQKQGA